MTKLEPTRTSSNPTATERLRELLDERGVEWEDCGNGATYVEHNGEAWRFDYDELFDQLAIVCLSGYTPEQAIAATLGAGTCHLPDVVIDHGSIQHHGVTEWRKCSKCDAEVLAYPVHFCPNCGAEVMGE